MAKKANLGLLAALGAGLVLLLSRKGDGDSSSSGSDQGGNGSSSNGSSSNGTGNGGNGGGNGPLEESDASLGTATIRLPGPSPYGVDCTPPTNEYNQIYWDASQTEGEQDAWRAAHLERLGYTSGSLSSRTLNFQTDYNSVSNGPLGENFAGFIGGTMGQVTENGDLDACTLNALKFAVDVYGGMNTADDIEAQWQMIVSLSKDDAAQGLS